ncbi:hypothetical protein [Phytoactinopolyspora limicola]|uniref:hypothetical protein n=1 Tax=Phytoactinopolyspora limicola TaxID=2715536 RepID=UPI00140BC41D|nr:hypothetical protein [Phytoactinopolyspora limicola]
MSGIGYRTIVITGLAASLLTGCTNNSEPDSTTPISTQTPPTATPTFADPDEPVGPPLTAPTQETATPDETTPEAELESEEDLASGAAELAILDFHTVMDRLFSDPELELEELDEVAMGQAWISVHESVQDARAAGRIRTGESTVHGFEVIDHDLDPDQPEEGVAPRRIVVRGCLVTHNGDEVYFQYLLHDTSGSEDYHWRVVVDEPVFTDDDPPEPEPCP